MSRMKELLLGDTPYLQRQPYQITRPLNPETSCESADAIILKLRELQTKVYETLIAVLPGGLTDYELEERLGSHGSTFRTRRAELVELGLVFDTGERKLLAGRKRVIWKANKCRVQSQSG